MVGGGNGEWPDGGGFSPGPMTLLSSLFGDNDDCKTFSELLAGAMSDVEHGRGRSSGGLSTAPPQVTNLNNSTSFQLMVYHMVKYNLLFFISSKYNFLIKDTSIIITRIFLLMDHKNKK
jgi:hypothetical protein